MRLFKIELLNPLFYYTGSNGRVLYTSPFIGDLALTYATNFALAIDNNIGYKPQSKPDYSELRRLPFIFTVARPLETKIKKTPIFARKTSFESDGFVDYYEKYMAAKTPFKDFAYIQGIDAGSTFLAAILGKSERIPSRFAVRLGVGRECLALVEEIDANEVKEDLWLNLFTLKNILNYKLKLEPGMYVWKVLENYIIVKGLKKEKVAEIEKKIFGKSWRRQL